MKTLVKSALAVAFALALPTAALACPSYATSGAPLSYTSDSAYTAQGNYVVAGGSVDLGACASVPGTGWIVEFPDFTMQYDAQNMGRALELRVEGACDTVLLVNGANGEWMFNDDASGSDPAIRIEGAPSGQYDIWVGTFEPGTCEATLVVETF